MYRMSKIPQEYYPEIISDISGVELYTLVIQDFNFKKVKRKDISSIKKVRLSATNAAKCAVDAADARALVDKTRRSTGTGRAWEGHYFNKEFFRKIIDENIPCFLMHKVKNEFAPGVDTVVCFMAGECNDIFLVHAEDLTEWEPNEV